MNKEIVKITSLVAGILTAVVALFLLIEGILTLTGFSGDMGAQYNVYIALIAVLQFAATASLGVLSYFIIKEYVKKEENKDHWYVCATGTIFILEIVGTFLFMIFFNRWDNATMWVELIFAIGGLVVSLLALMGKFEGIIGKILAMVAFGIGFILTIIGLVGAGGIGVATGIFEMFMFIAFFLFYLFNLIVEGSSTQTKTVEEDEPVETKAEAVEETKEEDAKVEE